MVACVVLGIAVSGLAMSLAASHQNSAAADERGMMLQAARALVEEIASKPFKSPNAVDAPGWAAGQPLRNLYDDVFDFDGYNDLVPIEDSSAVYDRNVNKPGYRRAVAVQMRSDPSAVTASRSLANFAYIAVTVRAPSGETASLAYWAARIDLQR